MPSQTKNHSLVVALTGCMGSGKSTVAKEFAKLGAKVIDADELARVVVTPGSEGLRKIITTFGDNLLLTDGSLDRKTLGKIIFKDPEKRKQLESIVHPLIRSKWLEILNDLKNSSCSPNIIIYVVPLYFEKGSYYEEIQCVISVISSHDKILARIQTRDNLTESEIHERLATQVDDSERVRKSDYIIENNSSLKELNEKVTNIWNRLLNHKHSPCS